MIFLISDTHFNHGNIIKFCDRPFYNVHDMNESIINNWNKIVHEDDIVYHLGDVSIGKKEEVLELVQRLNGKKFLLKGNHDKWCDLAYNQMGFEILENPSLVLEQYNVVLSHVPIPDKDIPNGFVNVHGHIHNNHLYDCIENYDPMEYSLDKHINISCEVINYTPININEILNIN